MSTNSTAPSYKKKDLVTESQAAEFGCVKRDTYPAGCFQKPGEGPGQDASRAFRES